MVAALRGAGRRITHQRLAIVEDLSGRSDHPTARQIHDRLRGRVPRLSLSTVYNTLAALVELGLLREMEFEAVDNRYDTNLAPHVNLVCTLCGAIADVDHKPSVSAREIRDCIGFETTEMRIEYRGVCADCRRLVTGPGRANRGRLR
jgi:Fe2+ or Zn2+ uptake regulation protein